MKTIHSIFYMLLCATISLGFVSCGEEEDESEELSLIFKMTEGYTFSEATLPAATPIKIGIEAETEKAKDPLIKFNISESIDGAEPVSVYTEDINTVSYDYDYLFSLSEVSGSVHLYTFTITNRDGIYIQKTLKLTVE